MNGLLTYDELNELIDNAIRAELWEPQKRRLLFFRMTDLSAKVALMANPDLQLRADLIFLNGTIPRDGVSPLVLWLQNSRSLVASYPEQDYFEDLLNRLQGSPGESAAAKASIKKALTTALEREAILAQDDMLPIGYLQAGLAASRSVARLQVTRSDNGRQYWGTGWLLTPSLLITNHHVFNARDDNERPASAADFRDQTLRTTVQFDVDSANSGSALLAVEDLIASDVNLDYAVVRLKPAADRAGLSVNWLPFRVGSADVVPLNIIQHPVGQPKRIAIRNNLATAADAPELRYFTSTLGGSSGSPVLDDAWQVVGIHRGSIGTKVLSFQGRPTAVVNLGTQMSAIRDSLPILLRQEIQ